MSVQMMQPIRPPPPPMQMAPGQPHMMMNRPPQMPPSMAMNAVNIPVPPPPGSQFTPVSVPRPFAPLSVPPPAMPMMQPPPPLPQGMPPPPPPEEAPPPLPDEPEPKKQKLDDSMLVPEDQFLAQHPGPACITVSVPNLDEVKLLKITVQALSETVGSLKEKISGDIQLPANKQKLRNEVGGGDDEVLNQAIVSFMKSSFEEQVTRFSYFR
ncbi:hypothetical protein V6N13_042321 [Hibiscus sabdariffa]